MLIFEHDPPMERPVDDLPSVLGRERHVLENLLFRLLEARGLLLTGEARFLHLAARDIEAATGAVREVELTRALVGSTGGGTLRELAGGSEAPLDAILEDHRAAIGRLAAEVGAAIETTTELAEQGLARVRARELVTVGSPQDRTRPRAPVDELDREIMAAGYEAVLAAGAQLTLPSLVAFLA
jgi:hypothetical protein